MNISKAWLRLEDPFGLIRRRGAAEAEIPANCAYETFESEAC